MENASKALIIAGSVLLSLLVIGALVLMFQSLGEFKQVEANSEDIEKLTQYNKKIESFNRAGLYGSEVMSLANLIEDYNKRQADLKGYTPITLEVTIKPIVGSSYFSELKYDDKGLIKQYESLESAVNTSKTKVIYGGKTASKISSMRDTELIDLIKKTEAPKTLEDNEIQNKIDEIRAEADKYNSLKSDLTQFKNKYFQNDPKVEYDKYTGRITKMSFEE